MWCVPHSQRRFRGLRLSRVREWRRAVSVSVRFKTCVSWNTHLSPCPDVLCTKVFFSRVHLHSGIVVHMQTWITMQIFQLHACDLVEFVSTFTHCLQDNSYNAAKVVLCTRGKELGENLEGGARKVQPHNSALFFLAASCQVLRRTCSLLPSLEEEYRNCVVAAWDAARWTASLSLRIWTRSSAAQRCVSSVLYPCKPMLLLVQRSSS